MGSVSNIVETLYEAEIASPKTLGMIGSSCVKTVRLQGDYPFHAHETSDEMFVLLDGALEMDREGLGSVLLRTHDMITIPKGQKHRTRAKQSCTVLLIGPE